MDEQDQISSEVRQEVRQVLKQRDVTVKFAAVSVIFALAVGGLVYWYQERGIQERERIIAKLKTENEELKAALHDPGIKIYSNQQFRFSVQVPGDWVAVSENAVSTDNAEFTTTLRSPDFEEVSGGVRRGARLIVKIQRPSPVNSIAEMSEFFKINKAGHTQIKEEVIIIANTQALAHALSDYSVGKIKDAHLLRGNDWFTIRYEYQDGNAKLEALYYQIIQSFNFLP